MRVLQINATFGIGSTGIITKDLSEACFQNNIESFVAFPKGFGRLDTGLNFYEIGSSFDHKLHAILSRFAGKQGYYSRIATKKLIKYIRKVQPDIVHLHNLHSNYINLNMLLSYIAEENIKTVVTLHDCWFFTGGCFHYTAVGCNKWKDQCGSCVKRRSDTPALFYDASHTILNDRLNYFSRIKNITFVGVSQWIVDQFRQSRLKDIGKIVCIHNGFDLDVFKAYETQLKSKLGLLGKFVILGPATKWLLPENRQALEYFSNNMPGDAVLLLFGSDSGNVILPDNVQLFGFTKSRVELANLYSMADVMVNCSREDTLSSLNIEAQACGTPVVTYDSTGNSETVDKTNNFSVNTNNYILLFSKVMEIYCKGKFMFSDSCRKFVEEKFNKVSNYNKYIKLYREINNG